MDAQASELPGLPPQSHPPPRRTQAHLPHIDGTTSPFMLLLLQVSPPAMRSCNSSWRGHSWSHGKPTGSGHYTGSQQQQQLQMCY